MADLDLDELEQLRRASEVPGASNAAVEYAFGLILAAPALIAAARAAQHRGETLERVAEAVGYPRGAHYGDVLGRIDEIVAERDRLRALCREAADRLVPPGTPPRRFTDRCPGCGERFGLNCAGEGISDCGYGETVDLSDRLRAAGGGT